MRPAVPPASTPWSPGPDRAQALAARRRDAGLARVNRLTKAIAVGLVFAVAAVSALVARAIPGGHTAPASARLAPTTRPTTGVTTTPTTAAPTTPSTTSGGGSLTPPSSAPRPSSSPPQAVTSPSVP